MQSIMCRNCTRQAIIILSRESRQSCNGAAKLAVLHLIDENINEEDAVVFADGSMLGGNESGLGFLKFSEV